jgi:2-polyprenyl-3-methyl-5-hydroxy-6-metoxy-1,4-benzoquinol methylase
MTKPRADEAPARLDHMRAALEVFCCPACGADLALDGEVRCTGCARRYPVEDGIPCLYVPSDADARREETTQRVRAFYEETPFPDYDEFESVEDLVRKAEKGLFARLLNDQIPFRSRVLEVGCGTGQLSNYLGVAERTMFGADMTLASLRLANEFRARNGLDRVGFYQMNLYRPIFREGSFDVVICNGVLCAAADPRRGFESIVKLVKRGGHILIGTYNTYGRLITDARRRLIDLFGDRMGTLDPNLRGSAFGSRKKRAWFADQYKHPHETKQSFDELLGWFDAAGVEFTYGVPNPKAFEGFREDDAIFEPHPRGTRLDHAIVQAQLAFRGSREGGFFTMIGRRR